QCTLVLPLRGEVCGLSQPLSNTTIEQTHTLKRTVNPVERVTRRCPICSRRSTNRHNRDGCGGADRCEASTPPCGTVRGCCARGDGRGRSGEPRAHLGRMLVAEGANEHGSHGAESQCDISQTLVGDLAPIKEGIEVSRRELIHLLHVVVIAPRPENVT